MTDLQQLYWFQRRMLSEHERKESLKFRAVSDAYFDECVTTMFLIRQLMYDRGVFSEKIEEIAEDLANFRSLVGITRALEIINGTQIDNFNVGF